jgi:hypothetical protein
MRAFLDAARATLSWSTDFNDSTQAERREITVAVERAATRLFKSCLAQRLLTIPVHQIFSVDPASMADVVVRDQRGRFHIVALTMELDRLRESGVAATLASEPWTQMRPSLSMTIHLFSLTTGKRCAFDRQAGSNHVPQAC